MAFSDKVEFKLEPPASIEDLRGRVFGRLTVVEYAGTNKYKQSIWKCICIEGNERIVIGTYLKNGSSTSCGCYASEITSKRTKKDVTGKQYNYLVAIKDTGKRTKLGSAIWLWRCTFNGPGCKGEVEIKLNSVTAGLTVSCGCYRIRQSAITAKAVNRKRWKGEDKDTARVDAEWEYEQEQMQLDQRKAEAAKMNWGNKQPEPEFNWTNKLPGAVTVAPDFDWWKDKLKGKNNGTNDSN